MGFMDSVGPIWNLLSPLLSSILDSIIECPFPGMQEKENSASVF